VDSCEHTAQMIVVTLAVVIDLFPRLVVYIVVVASQNLVEFRFEHFVALLHCVYWASEC
jgi:hypothetical protein